MLKALGFSRGLAVGVLAAAAAILIAGAPTALATVMEPPPASTPGLDALLTPLVATQIRNASGANVVSVTIGTYVHPWMAVSGSSGVPTGTFSIYRWSNLTCSGSFVSVTAEPVGPGGILEATFLAVTSDLPGAVAWKVHYGGNLTYAPADGSCVGASFVKADPTVQLTMHDPAHRAVASVPYGTAVDGYIKVSGAVATPTGTASISRFASPSCSGIGTAIGPAALASDGTLDSSYLWTFPAPGTWSFRAYYQGNAQYNAKTSVCIGFTVTKAVPTFTTALHDSSHAIATSVLVNEAVHARASLSSTVGTPTGTVAVKRYSDGTCTAIESAPTIVAAPTIDPAGPAFTSPSPKTESWRLTYSGDTLFGTVAGPCMPMTWKATPTVAATLHDSGHKVVTTVHVGSPIHLDTTVTGGFGTPTGQITFKVSTGGTCASLKTFGTKALSGGTVDSAASSYVPAAVGTYSFEAVYAGSTTYVSKASACKVLSVTAVPTPTATPKPGTTPTVQPAASPAASGGSSPAPSGDVGSSTAPAASIDAGSSPSASTPASQAPGGSIGPSASGPGSSVNPSEPTTAADTSGPGLGILLAVILLLLIVGLGVWLWSRRRRHA